MDHSTLAAETRLKPVYRLAWIGFAISLLALVLAWYGSLHAEKQLPQSPLNEARGLSSKPAEPGPWYERVLYRSEVTLFGGDMDQRVLAITEKSEFARDSLIGLAYALPFLLGLLATYVGATAMRAIERSRGQYVGNFQAVFSIMIGGFASVISGCMMFSLFVWPHVPSLYTR